MRSERVWSEGQKWRSVTRWSKKGRIERPAEGEESRTDESSGLLKLMFGNRCLKSLEIEEEDESEDELKLVRAEEMDETREGSGSMAAEALEKDRKSGEEE